MYFPSMTTARPPVIPPTIIGMIKVFILFYSSSNLTDYDNRRRCVGTSPTEIFGKHPCKFRPCSLAC
jgi:hypothetical protein